LINLQASHFENNEDEGQIGLLRACNCFIKCFGKSFNVRSPCHCAIHAEGTQMDDSWLAELLRSQKTRDASRDAVEGLLLLKMFIRLSPEQRRKILALVERYGQH